MGSDHDLASGRVVVRARVEGYGEENAIYRVDYDDFGMVASSGMIVNSDGDQCGRHYYGMEVDVITSGWQEGDLCFNIPVGDTDPVVFYFGDRHRYLPDKVDRVLGFWAAADVSLRYIEKPPAISDTFGTLANPVPAGESALASDGVAITVTSSLIDAILLGYPSSDTHTSMFVRARMESYGEDANKLRKVRYSGDLGIAGDSGVLSVEDTRLECRLHGLDLLDPYILFFNGGWQEVNLCFKFPVEETGLKLYYKPEGADQPLGFWAVPSKPSATGVATISDTFGTLQNPVPLGEKALAGGGAAISILSVDTDSELPHDRPPDEGNKYVTLRARVENLTGFDGSMNVSAWNFGLVAHSGQTIYETDPYHVYQCGNVPDKLGGPIPNGGAIEGNLCFQVPENETEGLSLYYDVSDRVLGFWSLSEDAPSHISLEPATAISDSYGTRSNPVSINEKAMASDGHAITIVSVNLNASHDGYRDYSHNEPAPAPEGDRYIVIRARLENHAVAENTILRADRYGYGIVTQSGLVKYGYGYDHGCPYTRYSVYNDIIFRGGFAEVDICFVVPDDETGLTLFYRPGESVLGFWEVSEATSTPDSAAPSEGDFGRLRDLDESRASGREGASFGRHCYQPDGSLRH